MCSDEDLLVAAGRGDRSAFGTLVERHHRGVMQFIYRFLGNVDRCTAEDLTQDVFLKAWKAAPAYTPRAKTTTYLLRLATNTALNYRRWWRLRRTASLPGDEGPAALPDDPESAADRMAADEQAASVREALGRLARPQRAVIVLRHFHGLSYAEIAEVLETTVSSVESLLFRARRRLRKLLENESEDIESPQVSPGLGAETL